MAAPHVWAFGLGVDSWAGIIGMKKRGVTPDLILFANVGNERQETYDYLPVAQQWCRDNSFPPITVVGYTPKDFKHWPPYHSLGENCLTNGTLPSLAFGFKSCSLKWKVEPQNKFCKKWAPAQQCWAAGGKVHKYIGYDASPKDRKRFAHAVGMEDPLYEYHYPLIDAGWDRNECLEVIRREGLPGWSDWTGQHWIEQGGEPVKSACYFCPATQPEELQHFRKVYLRYIVIMEARAEPRLEKIKGLWRNGTKGTRGGKKKPGKMTDFIREHNLLPAAEIDDLVRRAPQEIIDNQQVFATGDTIPDWHDFIEMFTPEDAVEEIAGKQHLLPILRDPCEGCICV